jgi:hypothetical protein
MKSLLGPECRKFTLALILEMCTTLVGTSALKSSTPETLNVSSKLRKKPNYKFEFLFSRDPVMAKTKMTSEKLLMKTMTVKGLPYQTPE